MDFLLRIFFSGLIAFVPSSDQKELTVLLLESHAHEASDGTTIAHHEPMLIVRAADCDGDCRADDAPIAKHLFADRSQSQQLDSLGLAIDGGGAWALDGVDLSVRNANLRPGLTLQGSVSADGKSVPASACERESFRWVPDLKQVLTSFGKFNPALFGSRPPRGVVAARLKLNNGRFFTYSLIRVDDKVVPIHFRALGASQDVSYAQAAAGWVAADIRVPGESIEIVAERFDGQGQRSMTLKPRDGVVEMAVLNLPPFEVPVPGVARPEPKPGRHFEVYYLLAEKPPAANQRPVPHVRASNVQTNWDAVHPRDTLASPLLERLRMEPGKGPYDVTLCPVGQGSPP